VRIESGGVFRHAVDHNHARHCLSCSRKIVVA
jgi:hypothetical protein